MVIGSMFVLFLVVVCSQRTVYVVHIFRREISPRIRHPDSLDFHLAIFLLVSVDFHTDPKAMRWLWATAGTAVLCARRVLADQQDLVDMIAPKIDESQHDPNAPPPSAEQVFQVHSYF